MKPHCTRVKKGKKKYVYSVYVLCYVNVPYCGLSLVSGGTTGTRCGTSCFLWGEVCEASDCLNMMKRRCSQAVNKMLLIWLYPAESYLTEGATNRDQRLFTDTLVCVRCAHLSISVCQVYLFTLLFPIVRVLGIGSLKHPYCPSIFGFCSRGNSLFYSAKSCIPAALPGRDI